MSKKPRAERKKKPAPRPEDAGRQDKRPPSPEPSEAEQQEDPQAEQERDTTMKW